MVKKLTLGQKRELIKLLSAKSVTNLIYKSGHIILNFDGRRLRYKVIMKHEPSIANWSRVRKEIHYDEKLGKRDILPVLVHEAVEKYVTQKYHLNTDKESHKIAQRVEKKFISDACSRRFENKCRHTGRCWRLHESRIERIWNKGKK